MPCFAAPLFPDVPENHWARDAVAALAAKGLVEGYPDGTFKGDRAASRWEVAMIVARLLAKMEQEHATFATKAELEELRKLVNALKEELDALGVRVTNLEEQVGRLDRRVSELERITFYGDVTVRAAAQSFNNTGSPAMVATAATVNGPAGTVTINYNSATGAAAAAGGVLGASSTGAVTAGLAWNPFVFGVLTATDWRTGRPLTSGTGFTTVGTLGTRIRVTDDIDAGAEFSAYTSQGDNIVDQYYGVSAPYLSNAFTAVTTVPGGILAPGVQPQNNTPFTRVNLDNFWVRHNPSKTQLTLGSFGETDFDRMIYVGVINPNFYGPKYLDSYGIQVKGEVAIDEDIFVKWETMGTKLANGNAGLPAGPAAGQSYAQYAAGVNAAVYFHEQRGVARINYLRATQEAAGGVPLNTGLVLAPNFTLNWVNPNGFYVNQLGGAADPRVGGAGTTGDVRPIPMLVPGIDGVSGLVGVSNVGAFGPQAQDNYGLSVKYTFDNEYEPRLFVDFAHTEYKPNKNSVYITGGNAWRAGAGATFAERSLDIDVHYLSVEPRFDPFVLQLPQVGGISTVLWRSPDFNYFNNLYSLHDTEMYPHNREGFRAKIEWRFLPTGRVGFEYGWLNQHTTSLQDVRFSAGSIAPGTPTTAVLGFRPGFMDPVFGGFAPETFAADATGNLLGTPLENPRGRVTNWGVVAGYKWIFNEEESNRGLLISGGVRLYNFFRNSNLASLVPGPAGLMGEEQNYVNIDNFGWRVALDYDVTETFVLRTGFTEVNIGGHLDPLGVYREMVAAGVANPGAKIVDIQERWPELGFDWEIGENTTWGVMGKYWMMRDLVNPAFFPTPKVPAANLNFGPQAGSHPYNWNGLQIHTTFSVKF
jgi:hypothetical protein